MGRFPYKLSLNERRIAVHYSLCKQFFSKAGQIQYPNLATISTTAQCRYRDNIITAAACMHCLIPEISILVLCTCITLSVSGKPLSQREVSTVSTKRY